MVAVNPLQWSNPSNAWLLRKQRCRCFYCERQMDMASATVDHLTPGRKGHRLLFNKVLACTECNQRKADRLPTEAEKQKARNLYANCGLPRFGVI